MVKRKKIIAVCDLDSHYALSLSTAISDWVKGAFEIETFTNWRKLKESNAAKEISVLIISESSFDSNIIEFFSGQIIVLRESSDFVLEGAVYIDRFQSRDNLLMSVVKNLPDELEASPGARLGTCHWKTIGIYSPIRRCLQTTFALALGQMLAKDKKVLYLNFENYSGFSGWMRREFESNILDLLYFFDCNPEVLKTRIPMMVQSIGNLDILPPAPSYYDTYERNGDKWVKLFEAIEGATEYEYLILDLTDAMQGLLQVMGYCDRIYTLTQNDILSRAKLAQYEQWMVDHSYADIIGKSMKFSFPRFEDIPERPDMLTHSQLAGYVNTIITEDRIRE